MARNRRRYTENAETLLAVNQIMKGKVIQPGKQYFDILPSGLNVWIDCRPDNVYLIIGTDREVLKTYKLDFDPIPQNPHQRCHYIRWLIADSVGKRVLCLFKFDGEIGSRHELKLYRQCNSENKTKRMARRQRNWKYAPGLLDPFKPVMGVVQEKPRGKWLSTWMREIMAARLGGYIYRGIQEQYEESITVAENEYETEMNSRRMKYRNLETVNRRRHQEKIERQRREDEGVDEPVVGFRS